MTTLWLALFLAVCELATYLWLRSRIAYKRYLGLMAYLLIEAACHAGGAYDYQIDTRYSQPLRMGMRAWVVVEVFRFACLNFKPRERARLIGEAITISGTCAWLVAIWTRLTPLENFFIFRGYYHIVLAAALWWLVAWWLRKQMVMENQDHRAYRQGMTVWLTIVAIGGLFVNGSAGYWIFPFHKAVWWWVRVVGMALLAVNVLWMGWRMTSDVSCLRPDVAYRNRPQAWRRI